jgi:hypothetical protein
LKNSVLLSLVVVAVIMLVFGTDVGSSLLPVTKTVTTRETSTLSTTVQNSVDIPTTKVVTIGTTNTITTTVGAIACPYNFPNGTDPEDSTIALQENSTDYLCARYYH